MTSIIFSLTNNFKALSQGYHKKRAVKSAVFFRLAHSAVPTSIPLRSISVAGYRPMEKQKRPAGRCRHSSTRGLRRANFDSAPLHLSRGHRPMEKQKRPAGRMQALFHQEDSAVANFDSASLHLSRGLSPYGKAETTCRKNAGTLPQEDSAVPTSIPLRSISVAGYRPYGKAETTSRKNASTLHKRTPPSPTSIPLRSISVAGYRPMEKQKRPAGRMQALFRLVVSAFPHGSMPSRKLQLPCIQLIVGSF